MLEHPQRPGKYVDIFEYLDIIDALELAEDMPSPQRRPNPNPATRSMPMVTDLHRAVASRSRLASEARNNSIWWKLNRLLNRLGGAEPYEHVYEDSYDADLANDLDALREIHTMEPRGYYQGGPVEASDSWLDDFYWKDEAQTQNSLNAALQSTGGRQRGYYRTHPRWERGINEYLERNPQVEELSPLVFNDTLLDDVQFPRGQVHSDPNWPLFSSPVASSPFGGRDWDTRDTLEYERIPGGIYTNLDDPTHDLVNHEERHLLELLALQDHPEYAEYFGLDSAHAGVYYIDAMAAQNDLEQMLMMNEFMPGSFSQDEIERQERRYNGRMDRVSSLLPEDEQEAQEQLRTELDYLSKISRVLDHAHEQRIEVDDDLRRGSR
jgi:hypothetical protein